MQPKPTCVSSAASPDPFFKLEFTVSFWICEVNSSVCVNQWKHRSHAVTQVIFNVNKMLTATLQRSIYSLLTGSDCFQLIPTTVNKHNNNMYLNIQKVNNSHIRRIKHIRDSLDWSILSLLPWSLLGWTMQTLSYTASSQSRLTSIASIKILSHVLLHVIVLPVLTRLL